MVNHELINLYWHIGTYLSHKIEDNVWGKSTVELLADWLLAQEPSLKGFSRQNLWKMCQFSEFYTPDQIVTPLVAELSWTHHLIIISKCRLEEFYALTQHTKELS